MHWALGELCFTSVTLVKTKSLLPPDGRSGHMLPKYGIEPARLQHTSWFFPSKTHLFFFHLLKMIWQRSSFILWHLSVLKYILLSNKPTDDMYFHVLTVKLSLPQAKYVASSGWKPWIMILKSQHLAKIFQKALFGNKCYPKQKH